MASFSFIWLQESNGTSEISTKIADIMTSKETYNPQMKWIIQSGDIKFLWKIWTWDTMVQILGASLSFCESSCLYTAFVCDVLPWYSMDIHNQYWPTLSLLYYIYIDPIISICFTSVQRIPAILYRPICSGQSVAVLHFLWKHIYNVDILTSLPFSLIFEVFLEALDFLFLMFCIDHDLIFLCQIFWSFDPIVHW